MYLLHDSPCLNSQSLYYDPTIQRAAFQSLSMWWSTHELSRFNNVIHVNSADSTIPRHIYDSHELWNQASLLFLVLPFIHWNCSCIPRLYNGLISEATYNNILSVCDFTHLGPFLGKQHISHILVQAIFFSMVNLLMKTQVHFPTNSTYSFNELYVMRDLSMVSSTEDNTAMQCVLYTGNKNFCFDPSNRLYMLDTCMHSLQKSICNFDNCICHQSCNCWPE